MRVQTVAAHVGDQANLPVRCSGQVARVVNGQVRERLSRYVRVHQPRATIDHQAEARKLANIMTLQIAADDPGYGAAMARNWAARRARTQPCCGITCGCAEDLGSTLRSDRAIVPAAGERVRAWGGASLAGLLEAAARAGTGDSIAGDVLLATAVAMIQSLRGVASRGAGGGEMGAMRIGAVN